MIAGRLTHRASVERDVATGRDAHNNPLPPDYQPLHAALPCFVYSNSSRELVDGQKTAMIKDLRAMIALSADIREADVFTEVRNRAGDVIIAGRLKVEGAPQFKHSHREIALQRIG